MEGQLEADLEKKKNLLATLDEGVLKLRTWITTVLLVELQVPEKDINMIKDQMNHDSILFCEPIREFIAKFDEKVMARELDFFRALFPDEYKNIEIPIHLQDKGFQYYLFFKQLFVELDE